MRDFNKAGDTYPVGTIVASDTKVWVKKENKQPIQSPYYANWWICAEAYAWPVYSDKFISDLLESGEYKILRLGTDD